MLMPWQCKSAAMQSGVSQGDMDNLLMLALIIALLVGVVRSVLWLRQIDTRITNERIKGMRVERITSTRALVFDGRDHNEKRPFYEVEIPLDLPQASKPQAQDTDPRASHAARLVLASIKWGGADSSQIIPDNQIQSGISPNTRGDAIQYLMERGLSFIETRGNVEITRTKYTLGDTLAQLPKADPEILRSAIVALPRTSEKRKPKNDSGDSGK